MESTRVSLAGRFFSKSQGQHLTLLLFALLSFVCYLDRFILGALLTPLKNELGLQDEQLGRLNVVFIVAYIFVVPIAGYLGDRFRRKWYIFGALLLWSFATVGSGWAKTYEALLGWRALVGFGEGIFSSLALSWIADTFAPARRPFAFAVLSSSSQVAAWAAYHYGGKVAAESGFGEAFLLAGVPGLALSVFVPFLREPAPGGSDPEPTAERSRPSFPEIRAFIGDRRYVLYVSGYLVRMVAVSGLFFWGAVYLHREYGVRSAAATSFIGSAYFLTGVPGIFLGGALAGRLARKVEGAYALWLGAGEVLSGFSVLLVITLRPELRIAEALILAQMFFAGSSWGVINPLLFEFAPARLRSVSASLALAISSVGSTFLSGQLIGFVSDQVGIRKALFIVPVGYFGAAILWFVLGLHQRRLSPSWAREILGEARKAGS